MDDLLPKADLSDPALPDVGFHDHSVEIEAKLAELAKLGPIEYDRQREDAAKALGVRVGTLDAEVSARRPQQDGGSAIQGSAIEFDEPEPWGSPVTTAEVLSEVYATLSRFVVMTPHQTVAVSLWVLLTYQVQRVDILPMLALVSPEKRCGKTTVIRVLQRLCHRPMAVTSISPAVMFRLIHRYKPTLLIDEADQFMDDNRELTGLINGGHTRDTARVARSVGDDHESRYFSTFTPKVISGIGRRRDTLEDRSVIIHMRRRQNSEDVERLRWRMRFPELLSKLARWAADYSLSPTGSDYLTGINDRAAENWEPLLAMARDAGEGWLAKAQNAAYALSVVDDDDSTIGVKLLTHIREAFGDRERLFSEDLVRVLVAMEGEPWADWRRGFPMTQNSLAKLLHQYQDRKGRDIKPKTMRIGSLTQKGYLREQFEDAWKRYIPPNPQEKGFQTVTSLQTSNHAGFRDFQTVTSNDDVTVAKSPKAPETAGCNGVTVQKGVNGHEGGMDHFRTGHLGGTARMNIYAVTPPGEREIVVMAPEALPEFEASMRRKFGPAVLVSQSSPTPNGTDTGMTP